MMKRKVLPIILSITTIIIICLIITIVIISKRVPVELPVFVPIPVKRIVQNRNVPEFKQPLNVPEFRGPPLKKYNPGHTQQMGILIGPNEEVLPLYGKGVRTHRDRYHYYTTTGGNNLYPIPVSYKGRDCMEDNGCNELYNKEDVTVLGKTGNYNVNIYKNDNYF